ncbi:hypothetical protein [Paracoccus xiamenensis]|uniref:hypothetical protein n=1 Tax=Paracoccus xiamenensis TaxID=2714901 RepID=UPI00140E2B30|nr:hypothetical protein [Paracoccus xiamenensis]NHF72002.1 hypothetical protein [Paracoccus xiamenensis]
MRLSVLIAASTVALAPAAHGQQSRELRPALHASVAFTGADGQSLGRIDPGVPFDITVTVTNSLGRDPPAGLTLAGWLRPVSDSNLDCTEAARSFLATARLPTGAIKLNGPVIGVASRDGAFVIADPELNLATANLMGAARFDSPPASLVADIDNRRFLAAFPDRGEVQAIDVPTAASRAVVGELSQPVAAFPGPGGAVWVLDRAEGKGEGAVLHVQPPLPPETIVQDALTLTPGIRGDTLAVAGTSSSILLDAASAEVLLRIDQGAVDALPLDDDTGSFALARLRGQEVLIHYLDTPDHPVRVALPDPATRIVSSIYGRWILAFDPTSLQPAALIDVASGTAVQRITTGVPVSEIAFTDRAAYLMLADQSRVGVLDLTTVSPDKPSLLRDVMLGQPQSPLRQGPGMLAALWPQPGMLAVHAQNYTGFLIHDSSVMGDSPPMSALRLRGGVPAVVATFDRSFREVSRGQFHTTAVLPAPGLYELVTTTGIGALSFCAALPETSGEAPPEEQPGRLSALRDAADPTQVYLRFQTESGAPAPAGHLTVLVSGLRSPWRKLSQLQLDTDGRAIQPVSVPVHDLTVIAVTASDGPGFHPFVLEPP